MNVTDVEIFCTSEVKSQFLEEEPKIIVDCNGAIVSDPQRSDRSYKRTNE